MSYTYVVYCHDCKPTLPMPFENLVMQQAWAKQHHEATKHQISTVMEPGLREDWERMMDRLLAGKEKGNE